jgi:hypothetical protein
MTESMPKRKRHIVYETRSKRAATEERMNSQTRCPISLEEFDSSTVVFRHGGFRFGAKSLYQYLQKCPDASNPVNRLPITDEDVAQLNLLVQGDLDVGEVRQQKGRELRSNDTLAQFMEEEARHAFSEFIACWDFAGEDQ